MFRDVSHLHAAGRPPRPRDGRGVPATALVARNDGFLPARRAETGDGALYCKLRTCVLQVMACGHRIDPQKCKAFCDETANLIVQLYGWYYMPVSVHKVLVHGPAVVEALPLPLEKN